MINLILKNGGATIDKNGQAVQLKSGYQVSVRDLGRVSIKEFSQQLVNDIVAYGLKRGVYAGFWVDNGYVYADISKRISTKQDAIKLGNDNNQISILKWADMTCIRLRG